MIVKENKLMLIILLVYVMHNLLKCDAYIKMFTIVKIIECNR